MNGREIEIPAKNPSRLRKAAIRMAVARAEEPSLFPRTSSFDIRFDEGVADYFPYWIGRIETSKIMPLLPPRRLDFFVVCNAVNGKYLVMRAVPRTKFIRTDESHLIEDFISKEEFETRIMPESLPKHINRQFIFGGGPTEAHIRESRIVYIPVTEVLIARKGRSDFRTFYINNFTGKIECA